jgi:L-lactate dehydrogenase complex protein LldG
MNVSPSKENILKKIRKALTHSTPLPFPKSEGNDSVFHPSTQEPEIEFAEQFTKLQGRFAFCENETDLGSQLHELFIQRGWTKIYCREEKLLPLIPVALRSDDLAGCDASITGCEQLVARTGTIVMSAAQQSGRTTSVYAPVHICVATMDQLVYDIKDALQKVKDKYAGKLPSLITFASGPSRTADIEKTLVTGVHGPKEVYCFLLEN